MKTSILLALFLGVIFAQTIPARARELSDDESGDEVDAEEEDEDKESEDEDEEEEDDGPALTCLLFNDLGCNTECTIIASAFSIQGSGQCASDSACQCSLDQDDTLEGLFRAKFNAEDALKKIKKDPKLSETVLNILREPFLTVEQTKKRIKKATYPTIYDQLIINDKTPAFKLVEETEELNQTKIKEYVAEKLKPILKSSAKKLKNIKYEDNMKTALQDKKHLQSIVHEVRQTKNKKLSDIVDAYLASEKIKEKPSTKKETLADAIGFLIMDTFVNEIEKKNNSEPKKRGRKPSSVKEAPKKKSRNDKEDEKPLRKSQSGKDAATSSKKSPPKKTTSKKSFSRFELPDFDKGFLNDYSGSMDETFEGEGYSLHYSKSMGGRYNFLWKKGSDEIDMDISAGGSISQVWKLDDANIQLNRSAGGSVSQDWNFGKTKYTYSKSAGGNVSKKWTNGKQDNEKLQKYKELINEWCNENKYLLQNQKDCTIY